MSWDYCYQPGQWNIACGSKGVTDVKPLTNLVPQDTTTTPAAPPASGCTFKDIGPMMEQFAGDNSLATDWVQDPTQQELFTNWASQQCPQLEDFLRNGVTIKGDIQLGSDSMGQTVATGTMTTIVGTNATQAQINTKPTASGAPAPASAPVAPSPLPSTGVIVGAAVGLAALLMLV